ncbi:MAG TPA: hypothetical protein VGH94_09880 [Acidimicrobiales bacterium]|jgi:hypothetical protein
MALPDGCELTDTHLVFWELSTPAQLNDVEKLYEHCCTVACTNALRPLGMVEIEQRPLPDLGEGEVLVWGTRSLEAAAGQAFAAQGYVLCQLRLPVQPMGAAVPPGISESRPAGR